MKQVTWKCCHIWRTLHCECEAVSQWNCLWSGPLYTRLYRPRVGFPDENAALRSDSCFSGWCKCELFSTDATWQGFNECDQASAWIHFWWEMPNITRFREYISYMMACHCTKCIALCLTASGHQFLRGIRFRRLTEVKKGSYYSADWGSVWVLWWGPEIFRLFRHVDGIC